MARMRKNSLPRPWWRFPGRVASIVQSYTGVVQNEVSDRFINYLTGSQTWQAQIEPVNKRRKLSPEIDNYDHIVVKRLAVFLKLPTSKLCNVPEPIVRQGALSLLVAVADSAQNIHRIKIYDMSVGKRSLFDVSASVENMPLQDIELAAFVTCESRETSGEGRLWTETDLRLGYEHGSDYLEIKIAIKWNTCTFESLPTRQIHRPVLRAVLAAYFPDASSKEQEVYTWSPQDFYRSAHVPDFDDALAASITTEHLDTELYPFQKRSVRWMLKREGVQWSNSQGCTTGLPENFRRGQLPLSFRQSSDCDGQMCFISSLFNVVVKDTEDYRQVETLRGGILAEEMGLGKTLEVIALISLHKFQASSLNTVDSYTSKPVRICPATLVVTPTTILQQWKTEINRHAPSLRVMYYEGLKHRNDTSDPQFSDYDIVLTTYNILSSEIHYTVPPSTRKLRHERKYSRPDSPLMKYLWWRVCLDEAQMIDSGISNAATVAKLIPRINSWGITGTPVKRDILDLLGLLIFLRLEPFASTDHYWLSLVIDHRDTFKELFNQLALRHTKQLIRDELRLPIQQRFVITMPFTAIEEQHYQSMFQQMCDDCGLNLQGAPLNDDWDPDDPYVIEKMRSWLVRLRQTALHPEVGTRNRRALGRKEGPLHTVNEVLEAMLDQSEIGLRADQRAHLLARLKLGQTFENSPLVRRALEIWTEVLQEASAIVLECREQLAREIEATDIERKIREGSERPENSSEDEAQAAGGLLHNNPEAVSRIGTFRNRLRASLEIEHMALFFRANAHFQIKSNPDMTDPNSRAFKDLERLETEGYELAKKVRQEILKEAFEKVNRLMRKVSKKASSHSLVQIPRFPPVSSGSGIECRRIMEQFNELGFALDTQADTLDEWRKQTIKYLLQPLVDEDEGLEITGDEYEESTKTQDEVMVYVQALRTAIEDRHDSLTGQENILVKGEVKTALRLAKEGKGACPVKVIELLNTRWNVKPQKKFGSFRAIISDLRALAASLKIETELGNNLAAHELSMVEIERQKIQLQHNEQNKAVTALRKEIDVFTNLMNGRLEYYRQLQQISDMVAPLEEPQRLRPDTLLEEEKLGRRVTIASSKHRYLIHLKNEAADQAQQRLCVICQSVFELGVLTVCGHQFCKECIGLWWSSHRNCPVCKRKLTQNDIQDITYKEKELRVSEEIAEMPHRASSSTLCTERSEIYSRISNSTLAQIKNINLEGLQFTTKIANIARHLLWIRESDPGAKSIIFSQFKEFLEVLGRALAAYRIGYSSVDKPNGIEKFKGDPGVECFLLHARAHSSGLNLINANHVFLCEPLINTALELQAIARVDRIGQYQTTKVYLYIIDGTVEQSIYEESVKRRLKHLSQTTKGKGKEPASAFLHSSIEQANTFEMEQAVFSELLTKDRVGGEIVEKEDLWRCLFGNVGRE